jgi:hypothetical protein
MRGGEAQSSAPNLARIIRWRIISLSDSQLEMFMHTARAVPLETRDLSAHIAKWLAFPNAFQSLRGFHSLMLTQVNAGQRAVSKACKTVMGIGFGGIQPCGKDCRRSFANGQY